MLLPSYYTNYSETMWLLYPSLCIIIDSILVGGKWSQKFLTQCHVRKLLRCFQHDKDWVIYILNFCSCNILNDSKFVGGKWTQKFLTQCHLRKLLRCFKHDKDWVILIMTFHSSSILNDSIQLNRLLVWFNETTWITTLSLLQP